MKLDRPKTMTIQREVWNPKADDFVTRTTEIEVDLIVIQPGTVLLGNTEANDVMVVSSEVLVEGSTGDLL